MKKEVIVDWLNRGHLNKDKRDELKNIILTQHRNNLTLSSALSGHHVKKGGSPHFSIHNSKHRSFSFIHNANNTSDLNRHNSVFESNPAMVNQRRESTNAVKFFIASSNTLSHHNSNEHVNNHAHNLHGVATKSPYHQFRQSLKSHHHHFGHHSKSDNSFNRVEAFVVMVGIVDFLGNFFDSFFLLILIFLLLNRFTFLKS